MANEPTKAETAYVCVIDDDSEVCRSIAWTLNSLGYSVQTFRAADEFLAQPLPGEPMTVLIDFVLPGMTGLGLCREIVARRIPCTFSVISGHADVPFAVEAMKLGAVDLLEKPFSRQRLLEVVNRAIKSARDQARRHAEQEQCSGFWNRFRRASAKYSMRSRPDWSPRKLPDDWKSAPERLMSIARGSCRNWGSSLPSSWRTSWPW